MRIRADASEPIRPHPHDLPQEPSPAPEVECRTLTRDEARGLVTSIVRSAPGASDPAHTHPAGGEEIFVSAGTFADERGIYSAGTDLRNPPGSRHRPWSLDGCVLFVGLGHLRSA